MESLSQLRLSTYDDSLPCAKLIWNPLEHPFYIHIFFNIVLSLLLPMDESRLTIHRWRTIGMWELEAEFNEGILVDNELNNSSLHREPITERQWNSGVRQWTWKCKNLFEIKVAFFLSTYLWFLGHTTNPVCVLFSVSSTLFPNVVAELCSHNKEQEYLYLHIYNYCYQFFI